MKGCLPLLQIPPPACAYNTPNLLTQTTTPIVLLLVGKGTTSLATTKVPGPRPIEKAVRNKHNQRSATLPDLVNGGSSTLGFKREGSSQKAVTDTCMYVMQKLDILSPP